MTQAKMGTQMFKNIILFFMFIVLYSATASADCTTPISRTNFSANSVLTSNELNSQFNTVYNHTNSLDGDCIDDNSIAIGKIDTATAAALLDSLHAGCILSYSDAATISVSACQLSVNGSFVDKTTASTVTWGCGGCSAEASSTLFYVYANSTSTGTTLNLTISTTAPNSLGYNGNDKVLGSFYNDPSSDIATDSIVSWAGNGIDKIPASARYNSDSGQTVADGAVVVYEDKSFDTHNVYSSGNYTVPVTGKYLVKASARPSTATSISLGIELDTVAQEIQTGETLGTSVVGLISATAGQVIRITNRSGSSKTLQSVGTANGFSIARIK